MNGRFVPMVWVNEFVAATVRDLLMDEMKRLEEDMKVERDRANNMAWARLKMEGWNLHKLWMSLELDLERLGETPPEIVLKQEEDAERWARYMPRSKTNSAVWRARKAVEAERRLAAKPKRLSFKLLHQADPGGSARAGPVLKGR